MDNKYKRLGRNSFVVFLGNAGSKLISIIMLPFYTRHLSTSEFGTSDIISTYSSILLAIVTCCLAEGILLFSKNADNNDKKSFFTSGLCCAGILFGVFSAFCCIIAYSIPDKSWLGTLGKDIWWIYFMTFTMFLQVYVQQFTLSLNKVTIYSLSGVVLTATLAIFGLYLVPLYGLKGYLCSIILSNLITFIFNLTVSKSYLYFNISKFNKHHLRQLLKYSIPLIPNSVMWFLLNGINRPIMESTIGLEAVGIYAVANRFPGVIAMLCTVFSSAWGLSMLEEFNTPDFNRFFNNTIRLLFFIMIIGGCFLTFFSKTIVSIFSTQEYFEAWKYMPILTLAVIFQNFSSLVGGVFMAEKKSIYFFYTSLVGALTSLILTFYFVKFWGLAGICIAVVCSSFFMLISRIYIAWRYISELNIKYYTLMTSLFVLLMTIIIYDFNQWVNLVALFLVSVLILVINKHEVKTVIKILKDRLLASL